MYGINEKLLKKPYRAYVLLSGGVDSTTCLFKAIEHMKSVDGVVEAFSMDYGQRHSTEMARARLICSKVGVAHSVINMQGLMGTTSMLTDASQEVPDISYADISGVSPTYVPFRNGLMLSRLAAKAQEYVTTVIKDFEKEAGEHAPQSYTEDLVTLYFGAHAEDAQNWAYPDCTPEFAGAMANAIYIGTYRTVRLLTPFNYSTKGEIITAGAKLNVPYELTWSCYKGDEKHCGVCPTCRARKEAFKEAGVVDPTEYAQ